jgi:solute:Na+ symporter, SSS family
MDMGTVASIDLAIVVLYLAGTIVLGLAIGRHISTGSEFFLAGRQLPWWAIGFSLVATDIGGTDIIGVGGAAYSYGLAVANFEWIGCVPAMIVAAFIFVPLFWRAGVYTIPEYLERRFGAGIRSALAFCWLVFMACNLGIMLLASARMMQVLFGWEPVVSILIMASLVGVYTMAGGLAAVVYTDVIQCVVLIGGCLLVLAIGLIEVGGVGGLVAQLQSVPSNGTGTAAAMPTDLILPVDTPTPFPWTGIYFGLGLILGPAYWIGNQAIVQRSFGARTEFDAKASYVWGALLKNTLPFLIAVPGLIAIATFPDLAHGDQALPALVAHMMPIGFRGLFLAAFVAALMSSVDSYLNSSATLLSHDLYKRFLNPGASEEQLLRIGRSVTAGLMAWAIAFAFYLSRLEGTGIYVVFQTLLAFFQGPALAVILAGVLWRRATAPAALVGFIGGVICSVSLFMMNQEAVYTRLEWRPLFQVSEPFLYFSVWAFLVALTLVVAVSYATQPEPEEKTRGLVYELFGRRRS